jgi:hypothetical protein
MFAIKPAIDRVRSLKGLLLKRSKPVTAEQFTAAIRGRDAGR